MLEEFKSIIKHTSIYSLGTIFSKIVGFIMIPIYTRYLTTADYGTLELLTLVSSLLSMLFSLRITAGLVRYYYQYQTTRERNQLVSSVLISIISMAIIVTILLSINADFFSRLVFKNTENSKFFIFIFLSLGFEICIDVCLTYIRIMEKSFHYIAFSLTSLIISLSLNIFFIVVLKWGVLGLLYSMVITNGFVMSSLLFYTLNKVRISFDFKKLYPVVKFSIPVIPAGILIFILNMGDRFILNKLGNLSEVGIYSLGYKFGMLLGTFIGGPFLNMWQPKRVEINYDEKNRNEIFSRILVYFIFILSFGGLAISILIKDALTIIATPEFFPAYKVVPLVVIGYAFYNIYYIVDFGFYIKDRTYWYIIINAAGAALNIGLNLLLIPLYGVMGAAVVTAVSFFVCCLLAFLISQHYFKINYDFGRILKLLVTVLVFYFAGIYVSTSSLFLNIFIKMLIILLFPVILYFLKFFDTQEMNFIRSKLRRVTLLIKI